MKQVSTRELLQEFVERPIGSPELQAEADRLHAEACRTGRVVKRAGELRETIKRASKLWLPQGKYPPRRGICNEPSATQCDLEDAVEAAGGRRGGRAK